MSSDAEKFKAYTNLSYFEQAKAFLNVYWTETEPDAEKIWEYAHKFAELDLDNKENGKDLDEFNAHRFLESFKETKTVRQMRGEIKEADIDFNKRLALVEFLIWKYKKDIKDFVRVPIGSDEEVAKAEKKLKEVQDAFIEANKRADEAKEAYKAAKASEAAAKAAEAEAKAREADAKQREADAKAREADAKQRASEASQKEEEAKQREVELQAAKDELAAALAELKAQEDAYNNRTEELKQASETGGMVSRNKAKNELAQHLGTDPLPLRRAKITQEAAVKKAERATEAARLARTAAEAAAVEARNTAQAASQARAQAEQARAEAERARAQAEAATAQAEADRIKSEKAKQAADDAVEAARAKVEEAEAYLVEVKARLPKGTAWWLDRSIAEQKKYLPQRKQK